MAIVLTRVSLPDARPPVQLPDGMTVLSVAESCRSAVIEFLEGSGTIWGKSGLAVWLSGPYRLLTRHTAGLQERAERHSDVVPASIRTQLNSDNIESILQATRQEVMTTLKVAAPPQSNLSFAQSAVHAGTVARSRDASGRVGWLPMSATRMRLADRVLSLVAVDYLMRPSDYLALLNVCKRCEVISFDAQARARGACRAHARSLRKIPINR